MSDIYSSMNHKREVIPQHVAQATVNESSSVKNTSIIDMYKNLKPVERQNKTPSNDVIIATLNIIKEAIEPNPISAKREVEKLINSLKH
jgi:hypothetical protein